MFEGWRKIIEVMERENDRLALEARRLRRQRDSVLHEARLAFGRSILPGEEIAELPEDDALREEAERLLWFEGDDHREKYEQARREIAVLEPTLEQMRYWGDIRDERDCLVRRMAEQALEQLRRVREERDAPDPRPEEGGAHRIAAHRAAG